MKLKSIAAAAAALLCPLAIWAAPVITIVPSELTAVTGDTLTVNVNISGLTAAGQDVGAFYLNLAFDGLLNLNGPATFPDIAKMGSAPDFDNVDYRHLGGAPASSFAYDDDSTLQGLQGDGFTLFSVSFTVGNGSGAEFLSLPNNLVKDVSGLSGQTIPGLTYTGACVGINGGTCGDGNNVPEPASFGLAALALLAAGAAGRARRRPLVKAALV